MKRTIEVQGVAEAFAFPDRAVLDVIAEAEGPTSQRAYESAASIATRVDGVLERHAGAIVRSKVADLSVEPVTEYRDGERVRTAWRATRRSTLEVEDFAVLSGLIAALAGAGGSVDGPRWQVDPGNAVHDEVRAAAAADARRRAEAYAAGLGIGVGEVRTLSEGSSYGSVDYLADTSVAYSMTPEMPELAVSPGDLRVSASVSVTFAIAAP